LRETEPESTILEPANKSDHVLKVTKVGNKSNQNKLGRRACNPIAQQDLTVLVITEP